MKFHFELEKWKKSNEEGKKKGEEQQKKKSGVGFHDMEIIH
jgi:hypothetical protein